LDDLNYPLDPQQYWRGEGWVLDMETVEASTTGVQNIDHGPPFSAEYAGEMKQSTVR
jgi:hypothetical protein